MGIITLTEFKTYLGITSSTQDAALTTLVNATNSYVETYCNRKFDETEYEELYDGPGTNALCLKHLPVVSIDEILVYDTEVTLRTEVGGEGYYYRDLASGVIMNDYLWDRGRGIITVTYTAGYSDDAEQGEEVHIPFPGDLKFAALELGAFFRNTQKKAGILSENLGSYSYRVASGLENMGGELTIPVVNVKLVLDRYRFDYFPELVY